MVFKKLEDNRASGFSSEEHGNSDELTRAPGPVDRDSGFGSGSQSVSTLQRDAQWIETTTAKANTRFDALFSEFKRQKEEGVKVSVLRKRANFLNYFLFKSSLL